VGRIKNTDDLRDGKSGKKEHAKEKKGPKKKKRQCGSPLPRTFFVKKEGEKTKYPQVISKLRPKKISGKEREEKEERKLGGGGIELAAAE